jgi:hypothetical protein
LPRILKRVTLPMKSGAVMRTSTTASARRRRGDRDAAADARQVEDVGAGAPVDEVAGAQPRERVVRGVAVQLVGARATGDAVGAGARVDDVGQRAGHDHVIAAGGVELLGTAGVERKLRARRVDLVGAVGGREATAAAGDSRVGCGSWPRTPSTCL